MKTQTRMIFLLAALISSTASAMQDSTKGLLPEVRLNSDNEDQNNNKALQSELMITKAENKAVESLTRIIALLLF